MLGRRRASLMDRQWTTSLTPALGVDISAYLPSETISCLCDLVSEQSATAAAVFTVADRELAAFTPRAVSEAQMQACHQLLRFSDFDRESVNHICGIERFTQPRDRFVIGGR